jgi:hypothetical protein
MATGDWGAADERLRALEVANAELKGQLRTTQVQLEGALKLIEDLSDDLNEHQKSSEIRFASNDTVRPMARLLYGAVASMIAAGIGALVFILRGTTG